MFLILSVSLLSWDIIVAKGVDPQLFQHVVEIGTSPVSATKFAVEKNKNKKIEGRMHLMTIQ
jgi:hypothetical protein